MPQITIVILQYRPDAAALRRTLASLEQQVIYSTHDLEFAANADRVLVIDDGRVLADGSPSEALDRYIGAMAR